MCGIAGIIALRESGRKFLPAIDKAVQCLYLRGPDDEGIYIDDSVALGHRRLSVIDVSHDAAQPMSDESGRYEIIFNGEFFNYKEHRKSLIEAGVSFRTSGDTEVLLNLYIKEGIACLSRVNGFFALAIYDKQEQTVFLARDRFGVKPLLYYSDGDKLCFASEMKALLLMGIPKVINSEALHLYLQLNYLPPDISMLKDVKKLQPGNYIYFKINNPDLKQQAYYSIQLKERPAGINHYEDAKQEFLKLLNRSVQRRMVSDVPLGAFLSGGIDSSAIVALACQHVSKLNTFSIGFTDHPHFDETKYAEIVAKKFQTNHQSFRLTDDDLFEILFKVLDYIDEPFADSSALNVYILSRETRKYATVALSGDGADELLGGYRKHRAEWIIRNQKWMRYFIHAAAVPAKYFSGSRHNKIADRLRQVNRFADGLTLSHKDRYWQWCLITSERDADSLLVEDNKIGGNSRYTQFVDDQSMNSVLLSDMKLVLPGDMLVKIDMMSMANSLEVRNPFLDYELVDFVFSLPDNYKIDGNEQKKLLRDAFRNTLPAELFSRRKQGFEVPLLQWFRTKLKSLIDDLLNNEYIISQGIFNPEGIAALKRKLHSSHPGDAAARIWALIVFQYWYRRTF